MTKRSPINTNLNTIPIQEGIGIVSRPYEERIASSKRDELWFKSGIESYKVAKLCLENDFIPATVFNLQQSVEKLSKTIFLSSGASAEIELVNHQPHKAFKLLFEQLEDDAHVKYCNDLSKLVCECDSFESRLLKFMEPINLTITWYNNAKPKDLSEGRLVNTNYAQQMLICLSFLFANTESDTRYPIEKENECYGPEDLYNDSIKDNLNHIIAMVGSVIEFMESKIRL